MEVCCPSQVMLCYEHLQLVAVSVYGPQIFEQLGYGVRLSEYLTQANFVSYLVLMTFAWLLIDALGRRTVLLWGSGTLTSCFLLLALFGGLSKYHDTLNVDVNAVAIPGIVALFIATGAFGKRIEEQNHYSAFADCDSHPQALDGSYRHG